MAFERIKKARSDGGDSGRSDSANSDKIHANSIDSNHSRNSNSATDFPLASTTKGQKISFKPYEDSPKSDGKDHRVKSNGSSHNYEQQKDYERNRKRSSETMSPKRSSSGASSPKRSSSSCSHPENHKKTSPRASSSSPSSVISYTSTGLLELSKNHQLTKTGPDASGSAFPSAAQLSHFQSAISQHHHHEHQHSSSHRLNSSAPCRDPYCTGCHLSSLPGLAVPMANDSCCNGAVPASHNKANEHPFGPYPPAMSHHLNRFSGAQPLHKPFPCHWTANGAYCGKSFSTCEELLQHLKTHTLSNASSHYAGLGSYYNQTLAAAAALRPFGLEDLRYNPYKTPGSGVTLSPVLRPPVSMPSPGGTYPFVTPSMFPPRPSLSSYYALLQSRLAGHGTLH